MISSTLSDCRSIDCTSLINLIFSRECYGLMINVHEIASHKLVSMAQDIRGMEATCASSVSMVGTIIKNRYQTPKADIKLTLVCYHLTISKITQRGLLDHFADLSISSLYVVKKESSLTKERDSYFSWNFRVLR